MGLILETYSDLNPLCLTPHSNHKEHKSFFKKQMVLYHPDKQMQKPAAEQLSPEEAKRLFVEATFAYEFLKESFDDDDDCE